MASHNHHKDLKEALNRAEIIESAGEVASSGERKYEAVIVTLAKEVHSLRARLDELMFEYCPDDMDKEQIEEFKKHQSPVKMQVAGPNDKFTCPNCGGHYFTTTKVDGMAFHDQLGSCIAETSEHGVRGCGFKWARGNDYLYFTEGPTMKGFQC